MNIILSAPGFLPHFFGGGEIYIYRIAIELLRRGHRVSVISKVSSRNVPNSPLLNEYNYDGISVYSVATDLLEMSQADYFTGTGIAAADLIGRITDLLAPDVVHINGMKPLMQNVARNRQIPHVLTLHHAGIACPAGSLVTANGNICVNPMNQSDCVACCSTQRWPRWYSGAVIGRIPSWVYRRLGGKLNIKRRLSYIERGLIYPWLIEQSISSKRCVINYAQYIIAPSMFMKDLLIRNGCKSHKISILAHGIESVASAAALTNVRGRVRFGYIGRIDPQKGLHMFLGAAQLLGNTQSFELHIFGAAQNANHEGYRQQQLSASRGLNIVDHGLISPKRLATAYAEIDVLVVPSLLPEAFGLVVHEAYSAGKPVIVFSSGALPELVKDNETGFIVQNNNTVELAAKMQRFIDNPELQYEMSKRLPPPFTIKEHVDELERVYNLVINGNQSS